MLKLPKDLLEQYRKFDAYKRDNKGEYYLSYDNALLFLKDCKENNIAILGAEGFEIYDDRLVARIDMIADFSPRKDRLYKTWDEYKEKTYNAIQYFLNTCRQEGPNLNLGFCFVLMTEKKYQEIVHSFFK